MKNPFCSRLIIHQNSRTIGRLKDEKKLIPSSWLDGRLTCLFWNFRRLSLNLLSQFFLTKSSPPIQMRKDDTNKQTGSDNTLKRKHDVSILLCVLEEDWMIIAIIIAEKWKIHFIYIRKKTYLCFVQTLNSTQPVFSLVFENSNV